MRKPALLLTFVLLAFATLVACSQAAPAPAASTAAPAASPKGTLYVMSLGGTWEGHLNKMAPEFEKQTGWEAKFVSGGGTSVAILNQLQAQKDNPQVDLVHIMDEAPMRQASSMGLFTPWDANVVANAKTLPDWARQNDFLLGVTSGAAIVYNTKVFTEKGWAPPTAWEDLFDPKYKGHVVLQPITGQYTMVLLIHLARSKGGGEANIDPGFERMKQLAPNVLSYEGTSQRFGELFQQGEAWIGVYSNISPFVMQGQGIPIGYIYPKEGTYLGPVGAALVKGRPAANAAGANLLLNYLVSEPVGQYYVKETNFAPLNSGIKLPADVAERTMTGDRLQQAKLLDQDLIAKNRASWNERWQKEIETIKRGQ